MIKKDFKSFGDELKKQIIEEAKKKIVAQYKKFKCPEHSMPPEVKIIRKGGKDVAAFNFCCDKLKEIIEKELQKK